MTMRRRALSGKMQVLPSSMPCTGLTQHRPAGSTLTAPQCRQASSSAQRRRSTAANARSSTTSRPQRSRAVRVAAGRLQEALVHGTPSKPAPLGAPLGADYEHDMPDWHKGRRAGIILHPTSLPGPYGIGELGSEAFKFIDWLQSGGQGVWQVLPLVPPDPAFYSPYSGLDANGGNPLLISIEALISDGLLDPSDRPAPVPVADVDFEAVAATKVPLLSKAAAALLEVPSFAKLRQQLGRWRQEHAWVEDSALFDVLRQLSEHEGLAWWQWPEPLRFREEKAIAEARKQHARAIEEFVALQFLFDRQWKALKDYANAHDVKIIGDMPIYVGGQSADVWANQNLFELGDSGAPDLVSGVPPDAFSETGQLWGSPLYRWTAHQAEDYKWWGERLARAKELYDETRIDHFRAFAGYWSVDAKEETAMNGQWREGPGLELFQSLQKQLGDVPILAEDLGVITKDVVQLREAIDAPGMVVLQFAWGGSSTNTHLPHMHYENAFCYPGTHDNETAVGWFKDSATARDKKYLQAYLGSDGTDIAWDFLRAANASVAMTCVTLLQDVMRLDNSARMNRPGQAAGNWAWRAGDSDIWEKLAPEAEELKKLAFIYNRLPKNVHVEY